MDIKIVPLSKKNLEEVIELLNRIFPEQDEEENVETCFRASLDYKKYNDILDKWNIPKLKYFLAVDSNNKVLGSSGIYEMQGDKKSAWVGWTAVHPDFRRLGIGNKLINYIIDESKKVVIKF